MQRRLVPLLLLLAISSAKVTASADRAAPGQFAAPGIDAAADLVPWTHLGFRNDPGNFQFLVVTDRTGGHRAGVFPDALRKAELLQPEFIMSVGDLIEGYTEDEAEIAAQWAEFDGFLDGMAIPFFYVPGNHGVVDPGWLAIEDLVADRDYTVLAGHVHRYTKSIRKDRRYIVLATTGGGSELRGPAFGEFDHVAWVTMTQAGPVLANLMLDGIHDEDVFTNRVASLRKGLEHFEVTPFVWDREGDTVAQPALRFVNDEDLPLQVSLRLGTHPAIKGGVDERFVVLPNSVRDFPLNSQPTSRAWDYDHVPIPLALTTGFSPEGQSPLEFTTELHIACERLDDVADAPADLLLDGLLGEWGPLVNLTRPMHADSPAGPDGFAKFAVARDAETLYLGLNVRDDLIVPQDSSGRGWNHDYVEIRIDPRPFERRTLFTQQWDNRTAVYLSCFAGLEAGEARIWNREDFPAALRAVQRPTAKGYDMEVAIPLSYLAERGGAGPLKGFSLNVTVIDQDDPAGEKKSSSWHPDWHTQEAVVGSGSFRLR